MNINEYYKTFINANAMNPMHIDLDKGYDIRLTGYGANDGGYAECIIVDNTDGARYYSTGYFELNGHIFITKWEEEYNAYRDNYQYNKNLIVQVIK
jgi:hypothetical protein